MRVTMQIQNDVISNIQKRLRNNKVCIKIYSILKWHERFYAIKRFLFLDKLMRENNFILRMRKGTSIYLPYYKTDLIQKEIARTRNFFEKDILDTIAKALPTPRKGIFLDIGSNIGNHTLYLFQNDLIQSAYCFEPVQDTFRILKKNISINNLQNKVKLFNVGVGKSHGTAQIASYSKENTGMSQLKISNDGNIPIIAIDDINFDYDISFVKIDVEGFELNVIKGMLGTIKKYKPTLFIEIRNQFFDDICKRLTPVGYKYLKFDEGDSNSNVNNYLFFIANEEQL